MLLTRLVVLGVCLSFSIEMAYSATKKKKNDGVFECLLNQVCKCGTGGKWEECWSHLHEATSTWIVNRTHQCERGGTFPFADFDALVDHMCSLAEDEFKECYYEVADDFKPYLDEVNTDTNPDRREEGNQIEKARLCIGTYLMECSQFGDSC